MWARRVLFLTLSLLSLPLSAEEEVQPSLELLEFLGGWEDAQGNWVDPQTLDPALPDGEKARDETGQNETANGQTND